MPNRLPADERRAQLVESALELAEEGGVGAVTVRAVAERSGVSLGVVHYCFDSKEALVVAMAHAVIGGLADAMRSAYDGASSDPDRSGTDCLREMLHGGLQVMWAAIGSTPGRQTLTYEITTFSLRRRPTGAAASGDIAAQQYARMDDEARLFLDTCADLCDVEWRDPVTSVARLSLALIDGVVLRWLVDRDDDAATADLAVAADVVATRAVARS